LQGQLTLKRICQTHPLPDAQMPGVLNMQQRMVIGLL
jgi:hypothetical protein